MADVDLSEDSLRSLSNDSALLCGLIDLVLITVSQGAGFPVGYLNPSSKPLFSALQANGRQLRSRRGNRLSLYVLATLRTAIDAGDDRVDSQRNGPIARQGALQRRRRRSGQWRVAFLTELPYSRRVVSATSK